MFCENTALESIDKLNSSDDRGTTAFPCLAHLVADLGGEEGPKLIDRRIPAGPGADQS